MSTEVFRAAQEGDVEQLRKHLDAMDDGMSVDSKDESGMSAIMYAARNGHVALVRELLDRGADRTQALERGFGQANAEILDLLQTSMPPQPARNEDNDEPNAQGIVGGSVEGGYVTTGPDGYPVPPEGYLPEYMMPPSFAGMPAGYYYDGTIPYQPPMSHGHAGHFVVHPGMMHHASQGHMGGHQGGRPHRSGHHSRKESSANLPPPEVARAIPCRYFPNCRFGDKCIFAHPVPLPLDMAFATTEQQQQQQQQPQQQQHDQQTPSLMPNGTPQEHLQHQHQDQERSPALHDQDSPAHQSNHQAQPHPPASETHDSSRSQPQPPASAPIMYQPQHGYMYPVYAGPAGAGQFYVMPPPPPPGALQYPMAMPYGPMGAAPHAVPDASYPMTSTTSSPLFSQDRTAEGGQRGTGWDPVARGAESEPQPGDDVARQPVDTPGPPSSAPVAGADEALENGTNAGSRLGSGDVEGSASPAGPISSVEPGAQQPSTHTSSPESSPSKEASSSSAPSNPAGKSPATDSLGRPVHRRQSFNSFLHHHAVPFQPAQAAYDASSKSAAIPATAPAAIAGVPTAAASRSSAPRMRRGGGAFAVGRAREPRPPCQFFAMGKCRYGDECKYPHMLPNGVDARNLPPRLPRNHDAGLRSAQAATTSDVAFRARASLPTAPKAALAHASTEPQAKRSTASAQGPSTASPSSSSVAGHNVGARTGPSNGVPDVATKPPVGPQSSASKAAGNAAKAAAPIAEVASTGAVQATGHNHASASFATVNGDAAAHPSAPRVNGVSAPLAARRPNHLANGTTKPNGVAVHRTGKGVGHQQTSSVASAGAQRLPTVSDFPALPHYAPASSAPTQNGAPSPAAAPAPAADRASPSASGSSTPQTTVKAKANFSAILSAPAPPKPVNDAQPANSTSKAAAETDASGEGGGASPAVAQAQANGHAVGAEPSSPNAEAHTSEASSLPGQANGGGRERPVKRTATAGSSAHATGTANGFAPPARNGSSHSGSRPSSGKLAPASSSLSASAPTSTQDDDEGDFTLVKSHSRRHKDHHHHHHHHQQQAHHGAARNPHRPSGANGFGHGHAHGPGQANGGGARQPNQPSEARSGVEANGGGGGGGATPSSSSSPSAGGGGGGGGGAGQQQGGGFAPQVKAVAA